MGSQFLVVSPSPIKYLSLCPPQVLPRKRHRHSLSLSRTWQFRGPRSVFVLPSDWRLRMPKDRRGRSISHDKTRASPYKCSSSRSSQSSSKSASESEANLKEWGEARCPVCMDHPHNAILLICSSHEKGCRPFMCDTSYRHSNCFDQFCKSFQGSSTNQNEETGLTTGYSGSVVASELTVTELSQEAGEEPRSSASTPCENKMQPKLMCPLCRGQIREWIVMESARQFMNAKPRSCACETCDFSGTYADLRKHARSEHPTVRPSETDRVRERNWRRMERQRDLGDLLSTLQSSMGEERGDDNVLPIDGGWLTFFLIRVFRPGSSSRSSGGPGTSRTRAQMSFRRLSTRLWGETHDAESGSSSRDEDSESSDGGSGPLRLRIWRRTTPDS